MGLIVVLIDRNWKLYAYILGSALGTSIAVNNAAWDFLYYVVTMERRKHPGHLNLTNQCYPKDTLSSK